MVSLTNFVGQEIQKKGQKGGTDKQSNHDHRSSTMGLVAFFFEVAVSLTLEYKNAQCSIFSYLLKTRQ